MIAWPSLFRKRRRAIRLRQPQSFALITGANREAIDATFDVAGRIIHLVVHTRTVSLRK